MPALRPHRGGSGAVVGALGAWRCRRARDGARARLRRTGRPVRWGLEHWECLFDRSEVGRSGGRV